MMARDGLFRNNQSLMLHILVVLMRKVLLIIANIKLLLYEHVSALPVIFL